jgi:NAD(P)-dependent dehydrogenase (short-subunit alcohol dehydrogenase family)
VPCSLQLRDPDMASYISGANIVVDGGQSLR